MWFHVFNHVVPCIQEEADARISVGAIYAVMEGNQTIMVNATDTGVVVIAISMWSSCLSCRSCGFPLVMELI